MPESSICGLAGEVRVGPSPATSGSDHRSELRPGPDRQLGAGGIVRERDDSGKESTNPKSNNNPNHPKAAGGSRSGSQRSGTNLKAEGPIIGLPARIRHVSCPVSRRPPPPTTASRIFPRKKEKSVPESEPTSPKVSWFGNVLSDRERVQKKKKKDPNTKPAWWAHFTAFFPVCGGGRRRKLVDDDATEAKSSGGKKSIASKATVAAASGPTGEPAAPGLGGMKRLASGRRSAAWPSEGEFEIDRDLVLARRSVGSIHEGFRD